MRSSGSSFTQHTWTPQPSGQTGSGKSFSMTGVRDDKELRGIIPNSFEHIFQHIARASTNERYLVRTSYLESMSIGVLRRLSASKTSTLTLNEIPFGRTTVYNEEIRDLLVAQTKRLELKEHPDTGVYVKDLSTFVVKDFSEIERLLDVGAKNRSVGATLMNAESSRSHSIFTITIEASEKGADGEERLRMGKLHLVDLAGSERQSKTGATGDRLKVGMCCVVCMNHARINEMDRVPTCIGSGKD